MNKKLSMKLNFQFIVIILSGLIISSILVFNILSSNEELSKIAFNNEFLKTKLYLEKEINSINSLMKFFNRFFQSSNDVSNEEFETFTNNLVKENNLTSICWHDSNGNLLNFRGVKLYCQEFDFFESLRIVNENVPKIIFTESFQSINGTQSYISITFNLNRLKKEDLFYDHIIVLTDTTKNNFKRFQIRSDQKSSMLTKEEIHSSKIASILKSDAHEVFYISQLANIKLSKDLNLLEKAFILSTFFVFLFFSFYFRQLIISKEVIRDEVKRQTENLKKEIINRKKAQKTAEKLAQVKSDFLANMSHEIRTPLNGLLSILDSFDEGNLTQEQLKILQISKSSGDDLLTVLNDVLDISKMDAGRLTLEKIPFSPNELVEDLLKLFEMKAKEKNLEIEFQKITSSDYLIGDPTRLKQVIGNLLSNAIKFTDEGSIQISTSILKHQPESEEITSHGPEAELTIEIKDSGIGIAKDFEGKLFESFWQAESSTNRSYGGTGLGLAISNEIIKAMGGSLTYVKNPSGGSIFCVKIKTFIAEFNTITDVLTKKEINSVPLNQVKKDLTSLKVLVVEDNEINQKVALILLRKLGIEADTCSSGYECLEILENIHYNIVMMDIQMPGMDGLETTKRILSKYGTKSPKIFAMTANVFQEDRNLCFNSGMCEFISKPIKLANLRHILNRYV